MSVTDMGHREAARLLGDRNAASGKEVGDGLKAVAAAIEKLAFAQLVTGLVNNGRVTNSSAVQQAREALRG